MEKKYLIINVGSSSKRYSLFNDTTELYTEYIEKNASPKTYANSLHNFIVQLTLHGLIKGVKDIGAVAFRIVAPGSYFMQHKKITPVYIEKLDNAAAIAPLHIETTVTEINKCKQLLPGTPFYAISDSAFHTSMPEIAKIYALPKDITKKEDLYRFGYHGISCASIVEKLKEEKKKFNTIIICHLSGGSSITAVKNGISIDTSMGYTPLEGVPMVSRVGTIDAGAVMNLEQHFDIKELQNIFFKKSGMIGLTGYDDMRKIVALAEKNEKKSLFAIELFAYQIKKYIGGYAAILGSIDLLVFTGGIGQGSPLVRSLVCTDLNNLGITLDEEKNKNVSNGDSFIHQQSSGTHIAVIKTQEMTQMMRELQKLLQQTK